MLKLLLVLFVVLVVARAVASAIAFLRDRSSRSRYTRNSVEGGRTRVSDAEFEEMSNSAGDATTASGPE